MVWGAIAGAVVSGIMSKKASDKQAAAASEAAQLGEEASKRQYELQKPYAEAGQRATSKIEQLLGLKAAYSPKESEIQAEIDKLKAQGDGFDGSVTSLRNMAKSGGSGIQVVGYNDPMPDAPVGTYAVKETPVGPKYMVKGRGGWGDADAR
jgi:hypothetical protein